MEEKERSEVEKKIYFEILTLQQNISEALELKDEKLMKKIKVLQNKCINFREEYFYNIYA